MLPLPCVRKLFLSFRSNSSREGTILRNSPRHFTGKRKNPKPHEHARGIELACPKKSLHRPPKKAREPPPSVYTHTATSGVAHSSEREPEREREGVYRPIRIAAAGKSNGSIASYRRRRRSAVFRRRRGAALLPLARAPFALGCRAQRAFGSRALRASRRVHRDARPEREEHAVIRARCSRALVWTPRESAPCFLYLLAVLQPLLTLFSRWYLHSFLRARGCKWFCADGREVCVNPLFVEARERERAAAQCEQCSRYVFVLSL